MTKWMMMTLTVVAAAGFAAPAGKAEAMQSSGVDFRKIVQHA